MNDPTQHPAYWPSYQASLTNELRDVQGLATDAGLAHDSQFGPPDTSLYSVKTVDDAIRNAHTVAELAVEQAPDGERTEPEAIPVVTTESPVEGAVENMWSLTLDLRHPTPEDVDKIMVFSQGPGRFRVERISGVSGGLAQWMHPGLGPLGFEVDRCWVWKDPVHERALAAAYERGKADTVIARRERIAGHESDCACAECNAYVLGYGDAEEGHAKKGRRKPGREVYQDACEKAREEGVRAERIRALGHVLKTAEGYSSRSAKGRNKGRDESLAYVAEAIEKGEPVRLSMTHADVMSRLDALATGKLP